MKRYLLCAIVAVFSACDQPDDDAGDGGPCSGKTLLSDPTVCPDRAGMGFGRDPDANRNQGVFIGQRPIETLQVRNGSTATLNVSEVTVSGPDAESFSFVTEPEVPANVEGGKVLVVQVEFAPQREGLHEASLTVTTNATNDGERTIALSGCGVVPDGGFPDECRAVP